MRKFVYLSLITGLLITPVFLTGCTSEPPPPVSSGEDGHDDHGEHGAGPHGGEIIELGHDHAYHGELVENEDAGTFTIYILDKDMKDLPIEAESVSVIVTAGDETTTHELTAVRAEGETTSAKFDSDNVFFEEMEHEGAEGKLRVTLGGEPHSATFKHSHDHDHGHDHGDEDHDEDHKLPEGDHDKEE